MLFGLFNKKKSRIPERNLDDIKNLCKILFIDDRAFAIIQILEKSGWHNVRRIKDVDGLDQMEVRDSHILFVDIQGVGKKLRFPDEGLGLIKALRIKYPAKKLIAYSAEDQGHVETFHDAFNSADYRLSKNASPSEFIYLIEKYAKESFSLTECVNRIKELLIKETGSTYTSEEIVAKLNIINKKSDFSLENVSHLFNLQNAANLSSLIQLFLTGGV